MLDVLNVKMICNGNSNSSAVLYGISSGNPSGWGSFNFSAVGPNNYSAVSTNTAANTFSLTGLSVGVYTVSESNKGCLLTHTFEVLPYLYTYTFTREISRSRDL